MDFTVRLILGSPNDAKHGNTFIEILKKINVPYKVSFASCHRNAGELDAFVKSIKEKIIAFEGGMSLAAPGIIRSLLTAAGIVNKIVWAVPTDEAARSAIEDLPEGTPVMTAGLNTVSLNHGIKNNALCIGHLIATMNDDHDVISGLENYYSALKAKKPLVPEVELNSSGLISLP